MPWKLNALGGYALLGVAAICVTVGMKLWSPENPVAIGLAYAVIFGGLFAVAWVMWRGMDEAAREAHKSAWFWGGGAGLALAGWCASMLLAPDGALFAAIAPVANDPRGYFGMGMLVTMFAQLIGFALAWAFWWLAKR